MTFTHPEGFLLKCCLLHGNLTSVKLERLPNNSHTHAHTHTITKRVAESGAQMGGEVLIEKASSFQEFAAEERQHNKVIKKWLCDMQGFISELSHTD